MASRLRCFFCRCAWKVAMLVAREETQTRDLPPPPNQILKNMHEYDQFFQERCIREAELDLKSETPLDSLFRMYECLLLDKPVELQAEARWFFSHSDWLLQEIPDPSDYKHLDRYAVLACLTHLLFRVFRDTPRFRCQYPFLSILTDAQIEELKRQENAKVAIPQWAHHVPLLPQPWSIYYDTSDGGVYEIVQGWMDKSSSGVFQQARIRMLQLWSVFHGSDPLFEHLARRWTNICFRSKNVFRYLFRSRWFWSQPSAFWLLTFLEYGFRSSILRNVTSSRSYELKLMERYLELVVEDGVGLGGWKFAAKGGARTGTPKQSLDCTFHFGCPVQWVWVGRAWQNSA